MPFPGILRKTKLTVTISGDVVNEINCKEKGNSKEPDNGRMLRDSLVKSKRKAIEKGIEAYYLSLSENEKGEDREWIRISAESAKGIWND